MLKIKVFLLRFLFEILQLYLGAFEVRYHDKRKQAPQVVSLRVGFKINPYTCNYIFFCYDFVYFIFKRYLVDRSM